MGLSPASAQVGGSAASPACVMQTHNRIRWENGEIVVEPHQTREGPIRNTFGLGPSNSSTMQLRQAVRLNLNQAEGGSASRVKEVIRDSDEDLVQRAKDGEFEAFEFLFDRHRDLVYRFVYQMTPRRDDAEDIVQEVFVRAYQNLHRYRDEAKFTTWLLRIAVNLGTDRARMMNRRQALEQQEASGSLAWMTVGSVDDDPSGMLEDERRAHLLRRAIHALPDHHRNIIIMRDIQEMEYRDIADLLNCTIGGAKLRVLRARRALRDRLAPLLEDVKA